MTRLHGWSAAILASVAVLCAAIVPRAAELDEVESALRAEYEVPLRWENLGSDLWVDGPKPHRHGHFGWHFVNLTVGKTVTFRTPPGVTLRFVSNDATLKPHDLDVAASNGSGLYVQIPVVSTADDKVLLAFPQDRESALVRVGLTRPGCQSACVAVFVSRYDPLPDIAPYRGRICFPCKSVRIRRCDEAAATDFWPLSPGAPKSLNITGPVRIALDSRYRYPPGESRMFQFYRIHVLVDGEPHQTLEYETTLEPRYPVFVDGVEELVSRKEQAFLEVPAGNHRLTFDSTGPAYICPYRQESPDFLLPKHNQPRLTAEEARIRFTPFVLSLSPWNITPPQANRILSASPLFAAEKERLGLRLARDNRHREGGLAGAMLLRSTGVARPDYPRVAEAAENSRGFHTFYRELYPLAKTGTEPQIRGYFGQRRLTRPGEQSFLPPTPRSLLDDILSHMGNASFLPVASERDKAAVYPIPERFGPSELRVAALETREDGNREFFVQFDQQPPTRLAPGPMLRSSEYVWPRTDAALALVAGSMSPSATLDVPFAQNRAPAPFLTVGTAEIPLPASVQEVRVWCDGPAPGLRIALQYRKGKPYRLSETEFLDHYQRVGGIPTWNVLLSFFRGETLPEEAKESHRELANQYVALLRLVSSRHEQFRSAVVPLPRNTTARPGGGLPGESKNAGPRATLGSPIGAASVESNARGKIVRLGMPLQAGSPEPSESFRPATEGVMSQVTALVLQPDTVGGEAGAKKARGHGERKEWLAALEAWSAVVRTATGSLRRESVFGRTDALFELGEDFLAERQLRGTFFHDVEPEARKEAMRRLESFYRKAGDDDTLEALYASAVFLDPSPGNLRNLAQILVEKGEYDLALLAALLPSEKEQPATLILRASAQLRWWQLYSKYAERAGSDKDFWLGSAAVLQGDLRAAEPLLRAAGARGSELTHRLVEGNAIRRRLQSPELAERVKAIHAWEQWQGSNPGPFRWQPDPSLAADYAGAANVYSVDRDLFAEFFIAEPNRPLRVQVAGPATLRFEIRPLHAADSSKPIEDWIKIERPGRLRHIPITNNLPSQGLVITGNEGRVPGVKITPEPEVELGAGLQELYISAQNGPILVRVYARRPEFDPGILPTITPETIPALAFSGLKDSPANHLAIWEMLEKGRPTSAADPNQEEEASAARGDVRAAFTLPTKKDSISLYRRMCFLLRAAETDPHLRPHAQAIGDSLFQANAAVPWLAEVHGRLIRDSMWEPVATIQGGAGVRQYELTGWMPEGSALRARTTLLSPTVKGEHLVFGTERLLMTVMNKAPTSFRLEFSIEDAAHLPPVAAAAFFQIDEEPVEKIAFPPGSKSQFRDVKIPAGQHGVRVWLGEPAILNQFLRLRVSELPGPVPVERILRRAYQVATPKQPLRVSVEGPAFVRVDELRPDGSTRTEYRFVNKEREVLELGPPEGAAEALFRVFRRVGVPEQPPPWPRQVIVSTRPVPPPMVSAPAAPLLPPAGLSTVRASKSEPPPLAEPIAELPPASGGLFVLDAYSLGTQESGTWSIAEFYRRRLPLLEDLQPGAVSRQKLYDEFGELRATHRYFDEWRNEYYETNAILRGRDGWNPTFGLTEYYRYDPDGSPLAFLLDAETYLQDYRDRQGVVGERTLWSALVRAEVQERFEITPKCRHTPSLAVFGRLLSEDANSPVQGLVDQDVYTRYKAQHRAGWELAESAYYRHWLDTGFWGRASVVSNENFYTIDHLRMEVSASQWLLDCEASAGYRFTQFLADQDRNQAVDRHAVIIGFSRDFWCLSRRRVEVAVEVQHEFTRNVTSVNAGLIWHIGNNRRYHDFRPNAVGFRDLRERRACEMLVNNRAWQME